MRLSIRAGMRKREKKQNKSPVGRWNFMEIERLFIEQITSISIELIESLSDSKTALFRSKFDVFALIHLYVNWFQLKLYWIS